MVMVREQWFGLRKSDFRKWVGVVGRLRTTRNEAAIANVSRASRVRVGKAKGFVEERRVTLANKKERVRKRNFGRVNSHCEINIG